MSRAYHATDAANSTNGGEASFSTSQTTGRSSAVGAAVTWTEGPERRQSMPMLQRAPKPGEGTRGSCFIRSHSKGLNKDHWGPGQRPGHRPQCPSQAARATGGDGEVWPCRTSRRWPSMTSTWKKTVGTRRCGEGGEASAHTHQLTGTQLVCYLQKGLRFWRNKGAVLRNWDGLLVLKLCLLGEKTLASLQLSNL